MAVSSTATALPDISFSYVETKSRLPSREVETNRGVCRRPTVLTRRVVASSTDSTLESWLATYTVRPSGETTTPCGSLPTRTVAITAGLAMLLEPRASGTRATLLGAGAAAALPLVAGEGALVAGGPCPIVGVRSRSTSVVRATATPAPPSRISTDRPAMITALRERRRVRGAGRTVTRVP